MKRADEAEETTAISRIKAQQDYRHTSDVGHRFGLSKLFCTAESQYRANVQARETGGVRICPS